MTLRVCVCACVRGSGEHIREEYHKSREIRTCGAAAMTSSGGGSRAVVPSSNRVADGLGGSDVDQ